MSAERTKLRTDVRTKIESPEMDDSMLYNAISNNDSSCGQATNVYTNFITKIISSCCRNETVIETVPRSTWIKYDGSTLYDNNEYHQQSGIISDVKPISNETNQQTTGFTDEVPGEVMDIAAPVNYIMSNSASNADLGEYLSRPVRITTITWALGGSLNSTFKPWQLFLNTTDIKNKIQSYSLLRGTLKLRVLVNASPFYYSSGLLSYQPLVLFNPAQIVAGNNDEDLVAYSQRPHINIYPQTSQGGELTLPFIYYKEWLDITSNADVGDMGECTLKSYDILRSANASAGANVTITVLAWMEDVVLSGPTISGVLQSDEYSSDPVSKPASAIAAAAGKLSSAPVIGPFMTATSVAAGAVSGVAKMFGFTNPPNLEKTAQFRSNSLPLVATTDIGAPYEKLTLDSKNELTVDPKVCGADIGEQMTFESICARESYLTQLTWNTADAADTQLGAVGITPCQIRTSTAQKRYVTPMAMVAQCFDKWRGTISVRLKVLNTQYHKGRLIITWDPRNDSSQTTYPRIYTHILDIAEENDYTFNVPWMQSAAFAKIDRTMATNHYSPTSAVLATSAFYNGILTVRVYTQLTAPVQTAPLKILVYVSGSDMCFIEPQAIPLDISPYAQQSEYKLVSTVKDIGPPTITDENIYLVYGGENINSVRTLMRRMTNYMYIANITSGGTTKAYVSVVQWANRRPLYPGYDLDGVFTATGITSGIGQNYNFVNWTYANWFEQCFVGQRGSINWMMQVQTNTPDMFLSRDTLQLVRSNYMPVLTQGSQNTSSAAYYNTISGPEGLRGFAAANNTSNSLLAQVPFYSRFKFQSTAAAARTLGIAVDDSNVDTIKFGGRAFNSTSATAQNGFITLFCAAGTDYNLIFFLNAPVLYKYQTVPTPQVL
nr:MAG: capsid protein [Chemarfal virus 27]